jgi:hypothetical protein
MITLRATEFLGLLVCSVGAVYFGIASLVTKPPEFLHLKLGMNFMLPLGLKPVIFNRRTNVTYA